jgi:THO complex subunit 2
MQCHGVLIQFHEFIVANLDLVTFETLIPSFGTLVGIYGIDPSVGFYLWRPILAHKIRQYDADQAIQMQKKKLLKGLAANDKPGSSEDNEKKSSASTSVRGFEDAAVNKENEVFEPQQIDKEIAAPPQSQTYAQFCSSSYR